MNARERALARLEEYREEVARVGRICTVIQEDAEADLVSAAHAPERIAEEDLRDLARLGDALEALRDQALGIAPAAEAGIPEEEEEPPCPR